MEGPCADSVEKHEPASDDATVVVDSLKALDPNRPIREADSFTAAECPRFVPKADLVTAPERVVLILCNVGDPTDTNE